MDAPLHHCHACKSLKPLTEFKLREKDDQYGKKGDPTSKCTLCTLRNQKSRQNLKRKRESEEPTSICVNNSLLPVDRDQFTALLANRAPDGSLRCSARVTTEGMVGDTKSIAGIIAGYVWEATGYRFTYRSQYNRKDGSVHLRYECCQSTATPNNKPKKQCVYPAQARDVRRMTRYDCYGMLYVSPRPSFCDVELTHEFHHEPYNDNGPSQALSRRERVMALVDTIEQAIQILRSQADKATLPWIENAERHLSEGVKWIIENNPNHTGDESDRTYPKTNEKGQEIATP